MYQSICRFFPNIVGAIDDIHLEIKLTDEIDDQDSYFCWKQYHSIHLQVCCSDHFFQNQYEKSTGCTVSYQIQQMTRA